MSVKQPCERERFNNSHSNVHGTFKSTSPMRWLRITAVAVLGLLALVSVRLPSFAVAQGVPAADQELATVPQEPDLSVHYVGVVDKSELYVAVVNRGRGVVNVYLCDGKDVGLWFEGSGDETTKTFAADAADGGKVTGTIADEAATGTVTLADGTVFTFTANLAILPAGFYFRAAVEDGQPVQARTIVLPDGSSKGKKSKFDCAGAEKQYYIFMEQFRNSPSGSNSEWLAGNDAHEVYLAARGAGCSWAGWPAT